MRIYFLSNLMFIFIKLRRLRKVFIMINFYSDLKRKNNKVQRKLIDMYDVYKYKYIYKKIYFDKYYNVILRYILFYYFYYTILYYSIILFSVIQPFAVIFVNIFQSFIIRFVRCH